jgi:glycosyltransferase involved in cell wall biosynthesis
MKLIFVGLYLEGTGFTRVLSALVDQLHAEITFIALASDPPQVPPKFALKILPPQIPWSFLAHEFQSTIDTIHPTAIFIQQPIWKVTRLLRWLRAGYPQIKLILYAPLEGRLRDIEQINVLSEIDLCLAYTKYAQQQLRIAGAELAHKEPAFRLPPIDTLPHGVDTQTFYPLANIEDERRRLARQLLFPHRPELHEAFIVLNANRGYPRKRIDLTLDGFAAFVQGKPENVYLYLHQPFISRYDKRRLLQDIEARNLTKHVLVNDAQPDDTVLSDERLNWLYNACDVGINTAMGEGWGLVSFEHAATGAAQIVPEHTVFIENWEDAALMLPIVGTDYIFYEHTEMYVVSPVDVAKHLNALYHDSDLRQKMAYAAYNRAIAPHYQWEAIAQRLITLLETVAG